MWQSHMTTFLVRLTVHVQEWLYTVFQSGWCVMNVMLIYSGTPLVWTPLHGPLQYVLIRGVSSFQGVNNTYLYEVGTWSSVLIRGVSSFQGCPLRGVQLYNTFSLHLHYTPPLYDYISTALLHCMTTSPLHSPIVWLYLHCTPSIWYD